MQFKPERELLFQYEADKHLPSLLKIHNKGTVPIMFKFKASKPDKISIKPSPHILKPGQAVDVQVSVHKQIVPNIQDEQIQILYGPQAYSEIRNFRLFLENGSHKDQLNLTVMVGDKEDRRQLEQEMANYKFVPTRISKNQSSSGNNLLAYVGVIIVGLLFGYFSPLNLFSQ